MNWSGVVGYALLIPVSAWAQGYRLSGTQLDVSGDQWRGWNYPQGTLSFSAAGVQPAFIRARVDAALDAGAFSYGDGVRGGIRAAGTNLEQAGRLIDGQEETFWEPAPDAPLRDWWVEIDLGRVVLAEKVVVKFVQEGQGDPFLQFKVLTSNGMPAFSQSKALNYTVIGRSEGFNKTQRLFEFELAPTVNTAPGFSGDLIQYLEVVATASAGGRAEEVSEARWQGLPAAERGEVLYFRREVGGAQRPVDRAEYEALAEERRGAIQYYRRELPRLAEVEVWTAGDDLSLGALDRDGKIAGYGNLGSEALMIDGDYRTFHSIELSYGGNVIENVVDPDRHVLFDLGAQYWVNRVLLVFPYSFQDNAFGLTQARSLKIDYRMVNYQAVGDPPNYTLSLAEGRRAPDGSLIYTPVRARDGDKPHPFGSVREILLFGYGFLPQVTLESGLIELGRNPRILSTLDWEAQTPPGTQLQIRTRTGNQIDQVVHYFTKTGSEVNEAEYRKLLSFQRGDSLVAQVPGSDWSNWSQFYPESGAAITSPSPRRYAMIQAALRSADPEKAVLLRHLSVALEDPLASRLVGEIAPRQLPRAGQRETFTLYLRPTLQRGSRGFDQVLVELPPGGEAEVVDATVGRESEVAVGSGRVYGAEELERLHGGADSLWVRFPEPIAQEAQELVALRFAGALYLASNAFGVSVGWGEGRERVWQRVDEGDATGLAEGGGLIVQTPFRGGLVGEVEVSANPFTPNGDGVNDELSFAFPVFKMQGPKALRLEVYSLDGHLVRRVEKTVPHAAGRQVLNWDGRDEGGRLAPPGLYLCRVGLEVDDADAPQSVVVRLVASVY